MWESIFLQYAPEIRNQGMPSLNLEPTHNSTTTTTTMTRTSPTSPTTTVSEIQPLPEAQQANQKKQSARPSVSERGKLSILRTNVNSSSYAKGDNFYAT